MQGVIKKWSGTFKGRIIFTAFIDMFNKVT